MDNRPIGVFDSGLGGLTAVKALRQILPEEKLIYFCLLYTSDSARDVVAQISMGSCSTQPGWGKICRKGYCALATISPRLLNRMARDVVVP